MHSRYCSNRPEVETLRAAITSSSCLVGCLIPLASPLPAAAAEEPRASAPLTAPSGRMAEPALAVDPRDPARIAVAADPYLNPTRIQVTLSSDGGRTWSKPRTVRPPGFARSFDPGLAFTSDGSLLISGGAARSGPPGCLPGSVIFLARLSGGRLAYNRVAGPERGAFLDRPSMAYDGRTGLTALTWTWSRGPKAHCLAEPAESRTVVAWRRGNGSVEQHPQPRRDPAVFGSSLAITARGQIIAAVTGWRTGRRQDVIMYEIQPGGRTTSTVVRAGRRPPLLPRRDMPLNLFIPALAIRPDGVRTIGWTEATAGGQRVRIASSTDGREWRTQSGPPADGLPMAPTTAYDQDGALLLVQGVFKRDRVDFTLWRQERGTWSRVRGLGGAPTDGWKELGQSLGMVVRPDVWAVAVPTGDKRRSRLTVWLDRLEAPSPTPGGSGSPPPTGSDKQSNGGEAPVSFVTPWAALALSLPAALAVLTLWRIRRAHRRFRRPARHR
jgi:hypothetical protein